MLHPTNNIGNTSISTYAKCKRLLTIHKLAIGDTSKYITNLLNDLKTLPTIVITIIIIIIKVNVQYFTVHQ